METKDLEKLDKKLTESGLSFKELELLLKSSKTKPSIETRLTYPSKSFFYGYLSDTHIGHNQFDARLFQQAITIFNSEKVDFIIHPGDHLEGMSGRPGHIYELSHIGFDAQLEYCAELYSQINSTIYGIDGNHDDFFNTKGNSGISVGKSLETKLKNYKHLGKYEADLMIDTIKIRLFHATDGSGTADSAKIQKLITQTPPNHKVNIIHSGHYHKALYLYRKNIHGFESATFMGQSIFMKGNKLESQKGFGTVRVKYDEFGIVLLNHTFYPSYY